MKKLFKSSFKAFLNLKVSIILLSIIVFITTLTFTLFVSVSSSFNKSYKNVTSKGNLHDFTIKEKFSSKGNLIIDTIPNSQTKVIVDISPNNTTIDSKYIYIQALDIPSLKLYDDSNKEINKFAIRINKNYLISKINTQNSPYIFNNLDNIPIDLAIENKSLWPDPNEWFNKDIWDSQLYNGSQHLTLNINKNHQNLPFKFSNSKYHFTYKNWNEIKNNFLTFLKKITNSNTNLPTKEVKEINFDWKKSTGVYNDYFYLSKNKNQFQNIVNNVLDNQKFYIDNQKFQDPNFHLSNDNKVISVVNDIKSEINQNVLLYIKDIFINKVNNKYKDQLMMIDSKSINVPTVNNQLFKITNGIENNDVDNLVIFQGQKTLNKMSASNMEAKMNNLISLSSYSEVKNNHPNDKNVIKGYKYIYTWYSIGTNIPLNVFYIDPSSFMAVVSPSYYQENKIKLVDQNKVYHEIDDLQKKSYKNHEDFAQNLKKLIHDKYSDSIINVDNSPYFITGVGTTPDYAFPIINGANPIPDTHNQAILFTNENGYLRINDAFRGNEHENYLAYKFKNNVDHATREKIMNEIEQMAQQTMTWGNNVSKILSTTFDENEKVILTSQRILFLNKLNKIILSTIIIVIILLILFTAFVVILIIKKQINSQKKILGILLANGYSKLQIAFSTTSISLIVASISTILGYVIGYFLQFAFMSMFKNYWTLPIIKESFSLWALLGTVLLPMFGISLLSFVITLFELRGNIINILQGNSSNFSHLMFSKIISKLHFIKIKNKISLSLFFTNLSKMLIFFLSITIALVSLTISFLQIDKFTNAKLSSENKINYSYKLNLVSPTNEGGYYHQIPIEKLGIDSTTNDSDNIFKITSKDVNQKVFFKNNMPKFFLPSLSDMQKQFDPQYLKGFIQMQSLINLDISLAGVHSNPWEAGQKFFPENQLNYSNNQYKSFINFAAKLKLNQTYLPTGKSSLLLKDPKDPNSYTIDRSKIFDMKYMQTSGINPDFLIFIFNGLKASIKEYLEKGITEHMPYFLIYDYIITNNDDETFTHVDGYLQKKKKIINFNIDGIKEKSQNIKLTTNNFNILKKEKNHLDHYLPVVANNYFLESNHLQVGQTFDYYVTNHKNRFKNDKSFKIIKVKVVGKQDSYNDNKIYTLQNYANHILGWTSSQSNQEVFNGIFTKHKNSIIFHSLPFYSISGYYPGIDTLSNNLSTQHAQNISQDILNGHFPNVKIKNYNDYLRVYSNSPYQIIYSDVNWKYSDEYKFNNLLNISSHLIYIIESILVLLSLIFVWIITSILIFDNKKFISTLKVLGYSNSSIHRIFFGSFIAPLLLAVCISIPIVISLVYLLKVMIMNFASILIPLSLTWWSIIGALFLILLCVFLVYYFAIKLNKNTKMLKAFK